MIHSAPGDPVGACVRSGRYRSDASLSIRPAVDQHPLPRQRQVQHVAARATALAARRERNRHFDQARAFAELDAVAVSIPNDLLDREKLVFAVIERGDEIRERGAVRERGLP